MPPDGVSSESKEFDTDLMVGRISASLGEDLVGRMREPSETPGLSSPQESAEEPASTIAASPSDASTSAPIQSTSTTAYEVPKSWKREMHEHWGKISPEAQTYIIEREKQLLDGFSAVKPLREALNPHLDYLNQRNIPVPYAVDSLLRAHRLLTEGSIEQRRAHYQKLGKDLQLLSEAGETTPAQPIDPVIQSVQTKLATLEQQIVAEREAKIAQIRDENAKQVEAFAGDTQAHPYFDEVAEQIAILVSQGQSLQEAYDNAVWLNPVTRAKEQARLLTEHEAKLKENARLASLPKRRAASVNISSNGDGPEPTEPAGSLEDTIKNTLKQYRQRA